MFINNPFAAVTDLLPMQAYIILMALAVVVGTLADVRHKGSGKFFTQRREKAMAAALRPLSGSETALLAMATIAEAAVSGEFCKWPRRISHLLMMYGFFLYVITTVVMIFAYPGGVTTPILLPTLWTVGALMILVGGLWFFFFLRVNVTYDGDSPFHLGQADLFVGSLIVSVAFALLWHYMQTTARLHRSDVDIVRDLHLLYDAAFRFGSLVQVRAHVFQARGRVPKKGRGRKRLLRPSEPFN